MSQTTLSGPASVTLADVEVGHALPSQVVDVSTRTVISTAIASRDYQDVHHDVEQARARGTRTIFMNILSSNGFVLRFVTDWAGPEAIVRTSRIRLGVPNYAGEQMRLTGTVTRVEDLGDEGLVEVRVSGDNSVGQHVDGTVEITVPKGA